MLAWSTSRSPFRCWGRALQLACSEAYWSEWALVREAHTGEPDDSGHHKPKFSLYRPIPQWRRGNGPVKRARFRPRVAKGLASGRRRDTIFMRTAIIKRKTKETDVEVSVNLDGSGLCNVATGIGFFDHMLDLLARHSRIDLTVKAIGDLHIDHHHTTEDVGIAFGQAVKQALGTMAGITSYASVHMPIDDTLSRVVIDISC